MSGTAARSDPSARRSGWIPWVFVGGMAIVFVVNMVLLYAAVTTFTGVTDSRAYDHGRSYNRVLAEAARQDALGWHATVAAEGLAEGGVLRIAVADREGLPVAGRLDGVLHAPLEGLDVPLSLAAVAPGRWQAQIALPRAGLWEARLTLAGADDRRFDIRERLVLR